jgi:hypothetical protein
MQSCSEQKLSNGLEPESREALESKIEAASFLRLQLRQQVKQPKLIFYPRLDISYFERKRINERVASDKALT